MDELRAFLTARLGEDRDRPGFLRAMAAALPPDAEKYLSELADQLEREVEAKQRLVRSWPDPFGRWTAEQAAPAQAMKERVLRLLAEPYAAHPDYREEWRP